MMSQKRKMPICHLRNKYSDYVFLFLKRYIDELNIKNKIMDIGAGHFRNLNLFYKLGFNELYALDKEPTDNPLRVQLKEFKLWDIENGIPYKNQDFEIVLCNYVLMFVDPLKLSPIINELMRISKKFLIIETNPQKYKNCKTTHFKTYSFKTIVNEIEKNTEFELLQVRKYYEKILAKRKS